MRFSFIRLVAVASAMAWLAAPVSADDNQEANRLFVEAVKAQSEYVELGNTFQNMLPELETFDHMLALLEKVHENLTSIVEGYPGSDLAVKLVIGETIGPFSLKDLDGIEEELEVARRELRPRLVEWQERERIARQCFDKPTLGCVLDEALVGVREIEGASDRARALSDIAQAQAEAGLFTEALDIARGIEDASFRARALTAIAQAKDDPALFTEALDTAQGIEDASFRAWALSGIAVALPE